VDGVEKHAQTDFFEYHWADKTQGNRLDDLWPTFRRILLQPPSRVPAGLRVVWVVAWLAIAAAAWACIWGPWRDALSGDGDLISRLVSAVIAGGVAAAALSYLIARVLPRWLTSSFVDVVRYLDTSPVPTPYAARFAKGWWIYSKPCRSRRRHGTTALCSSRTAWARSWPTTPSHTCGA
jgi:hypothetical protein